MENYLVKARKVYANCGDETQSALREIFGDDILPIEDRIRTLDDAIEFLGKQHPLVQVRNVMLSHESDILKSSIAEIELSIICTALNEGSMPEKSGFAPMFYVRNELGNGGVYTRTNDAYFIYGYSTLSYWPSGMRLASLRHVLKTHSLSEYAGKQFIEYWKEYVMS